MSGGENEGAVSVDRRAFEKGLSRKLLPDDQANWLLPMSRAKVRAFAGKMKGAAKR